MLGTRRGGPIVWGDAWDPDTMRGAGLDSGEVMPALRLSLPPPTFKCGGNGGGMSIGAPSSTSSLLCAGASEASKAESASADGETVAFKGCSAAEDRGEAKAAEEAETKPRAEEEVRGEVEGLGRAGV